MLKIAEYRGVAIYAEMLELGKIVGSFTTIERRWEYYYGDSFSDVFERAKVLIDIMKRRRTK